ncbi:MAG: hypothetical protein ICV68_03940 [Pyrinomonadaceae bacterium]|nr:hypothetical protein [Pyrinomonadaceae bacterium]
MLIYRHQLRQIARPNDIAASIKSTRNPKLLMVRTLLQAATLMKEL